jgi:hypothetical protein
MASNPIYEFYAQLRDYQLRDYLKYGAGFRLLTILLWLAWATF